MLFPQQTVSHCTDATGDFSIHQVSRQPSETTSKSKRRLANKLGWTQIEFWIFLSACRDSWTVCHATDEDCATATYSEREAIWKSTKKRWYWTKIQQDYKSEHSVPVHQCADHRTHKYSYQAIPFGDPWKAHCAKSAVSITGQNLSFSTISVIIIKFSF